MDLWLSLPEEFRISALICLGAAAPLAALFVLGRLLTWRQRGSLLPMALVAGGALAMGTALSLFLDVQPGLPGVVEAKQEAIDIRDARWTHTLRLMVRYTPPGAGAPRSSLLQTDAGLYDRLQPGDPVNVRYLHLGGWFTFARISQRTTLSMLVGSDLALVWAAVLLGLLVLIGLTSGGLRKAMGGVLLLVALPITLLLEPMHQWRTAAPLIGPQAQAAGTVLAVTRITEVGGGDESEPDRLWQPVDLVQVEFIPNGWQHAVKAADLLDAGSLSLAPGDRVSVRYLAGAPRRVQIEGGERSYGMKNSVGLLAYPAALAGLLGALALAAWMRRLARASMPDDA
jgi:hypothetical protein